MNTPSPAFSVLHVFRNTRPPSRCAAAKSSAVTSYMSLTTSRGPKPVMSRSASLELMRRDSAELTTAYGSSSAPRSSML
jgi:hypothetical protein